MENFFKIFLLHAILFSMVSMSSFANDNYYIHANRLNVRKTPDGKIIGKLTLNQTVEVIGSKDGWYEISFNGAKAYISKSFVKNRRFSRKDGLKKWFELNPNSTKTPVTLKHENGFITLCQDTVVNGEYLNLTLIDIFLDKYVCQVVNCSDTIWLENEQIIIDWPIIAKAFPGIYRTNTTNQSKTNKTDNGEGGPNWTVLIVVFVCVLILYRFWKKRNFVDSNDNRGTQWVYAVSNPAFGDDIYKIGMTTRPNLKARIKELSNSTSVPTPFELEAAIKVIDAPNIEKKIHRQLARYRINDRREFFQVELSKILYHFDKYGEVYTK